MSGQEMRLLMEMANPNVKTVAETGSIISILNLNDSDIRISGEKGSERIWEVWVQTSRSSWRMIHSYGNATKSFAQQNPDKAEEFRNKAYEVFNRLRDGSLVAAEDVNDGYLSTYEMSEFI